MLLRVSFCPSNDGARRCTAVLRSTPVCGPRTRAVRGVAARARVLLCGVHTMADVVIRHGTLVDGTGAPSREADVAIKDGKILAVGARLDIRGAEEIDAKGRLVCPGWVDCHTHYDAQVGWDSEMSPSGWHGVTTVVFVRQLACSAV